MGIQGTFRKRVHQRIKKRPPLLVHLAPMLTGGCLLVFSTPQPLFRDVLLSMFSDMVERIMEVYMDDITIYGGDFEECLTNLEAIPA